MTIVQRFPTGPTVGADELLSSLVVDTVDGPLTVGDPRVVSMAVRPSRRARLASWISPRSASAIWAGHRASG